MSQRITSLLNIIYKDFQAARLPDARTARALQTELDALAQELSVKNPQLARRLNVARTLRNAGDVADLSVLINEILLTK